MENEKSPKGVKGGRGLSSVDSLYVSGVGDFAVSYGDKHHPRTYQVQEKHETLATGGVRFNIETVPAPEEKHLIKAKIGREHFLQTIRENAKAVYEKSESRYSFPGSETQQDVRLEAVSKCPEDLVFVGSQGFFAACLSAFAQHLPLAVSPDHIWALLSFAFAQHVDKNAEALRSNFVKHEGKKRLEVDADHMAMSGGGDPDSGTPPEVWEQTIFSNFSQQIKQHIGEKIHSAIASDFSTTTAISRAAHEITLMSAMKNYFSYGMSTCCGIPIITLLGSLEDWENLRARAKHLGTLMVPAFSKKWMGVLLPVLDEFVASYKGQVNHGFWQSMVKLRHRGGSGAMSRISGWLPIFFPYLKGSHLNEDLRPWQEMYFTGPDPDNIPSILSTAPVDWNYYGTTYDLHFCAGFAGCKQDSDGTLTPVLGWYVTHDPPSEPKERLKVVTAEIEALLKGHKQEADADVLDTNQPWYRRVQVLVLEQKTIHESLMKQIKQNEERNETELGQTWRSDNYKKELQERIKTVAEDKIELEAITSFGSVDNAFKVVVSKAA